MLGSLARTRRVSDLLSNGSFASGLATWAYARHISDQLSTMEEMMGVCVLQRRILTGAWKRLIKCSIALSSRSLGRPMNITGKGPKFDRGRSPNVVGREEYSRACSNHVRPSIAAQGTEWQDSQEHTCSKATAFREGGRGICVNTIEIADKGISRSTLKGRDPHSRQRRNSQGHSQPLPSVSGKNSLP